MSLKSVKLVTSSEMLDPLFHIFLIDATSNSITLTLKNITNDGEKFIIKRIDSNLLNIVTIQGFSTLQTIEANLSINLGLLNSITIFSYNNVWYYA